MSRSGWSGDLWECDVAVFVAAAPFAPGAAATSSFAAAAVAVPAGAAAAASAAATTPVCWCAFDGAGAVSASSGVFVTASVAADAAAGSAVCGGAFGVGCSRLRRGAASSGVWGGWGVRKILSLRPATSADSMLCNAAMLGHVKH